MSQISFPKDMFHLRHGEQPLYGEQPDLRQAVDYFKSLLKEGEWEGRRAAIATRFYQSLIGERPTEKGTYYDDRDLFGWFLFLGEAFNDHPWNYEIYYGSRVVPVLATIGHSLDILKSIDGFEDRAKRLVHNDRAQPNGLLFEMLVAAAYGRAGAKVVMRPETPGQGKSHDLDVELGGKRWAIECKRLEGGGEYAETERLRIHELWDSACAKLVKQERSCLLNIEFKVELNQVPDDYIFYRTGRFLNGYKTGYLWSDRVADGDFSDLSLSDLQDALKKRPIVHPSPFFTKLLTGDHKRGDSLLSMLRIRYASNPHYVKEIDLAVLNKWDSRAEAAIERKARDITKRLSDANSQLPADIPGVIHIGFDCLGKDEIEVRRYNKIINSTRDFDRGASQLEVIYCHYFSPDPTPEDVWAIDETIQWRAISQERPLKPGRVLLSDGPGRKGVYWDSEFATLDEEEADAAVVPSDAKSKRLLQRLRKLFGPLITSGDR